MEDGTKVQGHIARARFEDLTGEDTTTRHPLAPPHASRGLTPT
jgi:hypothetical protein